MSQHTLIALVHDRSGSAQHTMSSLRHRFRTIAALSIARSEVPGISRMTIVIDASDAPGVVQQLNRLPEVLGVTDVTHAVSVAHDYREQADGAPYEVAA